LPFLKVPPWFFLRRAFGTGDRPPFPHLFSLRKRPAAPSYAGAACELKIFLRKPRTVYYTMPAPKKQPPAAIFRKENGPFPQGRGHMANRRKERRQGKKFF